MAGANSAYPNALSVTTTDKFSPEITDAVTTYQKFLRFLDAKGFKKQVKGGIYIAERVFSTANTTVKSIAPGGTFDTTMQQPFDVAQFPYRILVGTASFTGLEIFQNSGSKEQISDLVADELEVLEISFANEVDRQLLAGDGTGNGGLDIIGLPALVEDGTAWSTVGNIDSNANTFWRNQWIGSSGAAAANLVDDMRTMRLSTELNNKMTDLIVTTQAVREAYEASCQQILRMVPKENKFAADLGLPNVEYAGIPMIHDNNVLTGYMYFLNASSFRWNVGAGHDMKMGPFVSPYNQDIRTRPVILYCAPSLRDRRANGVINGIT